MSIRAAPALGLKTLGSFTGVGPFKHDDPRDRPASVFGGDVTLHAGPERRAYADAAGHSGGVKRSGDHSIPGLNCERRLMILPATMNTPSPV